MSTTQKIQGSSGNITTHIMGELTVNFTTDGIIQPITLLIGKSGCGKTQLLNSIADHNEDAIFPGYIGQYGETDTYIRLINMYDQGYDNINEALSYFDIDLRIAGVDKDGYVIFETLSGIRLYKQLPSGYDAIIRKFIYLYLRKAENRVVLIESPEDGLHPSLQAKMFGFYEKYARDNNCQFIIATNSPHLIASVAHTAIRLLERTTSGMSVTIPQKPFLDVDINTILETVMDTPTIPFFILAMRKEYREVYTAGKEDTDKGRDLLNKLLKYESLSSSFFQELFFDRSLNE